MTPPDPAPTANAEEVWRRHLGQQIDPTALVRQLTDGTIPSALAASVERWPERIAVTVDDRAVTYAQLDARTARTAGWLAKRGVSEGDRVLLYGESSTAFVVAYLGVLRAGATAVLANPGYTPSELSHLVHVSRTQVALVADGHSGQTQPLARLDPTVREIGSFGEAASGPPAAPVDITSDAVALLAFTSGTTGTPKAVPLTHGNLLASIRGAMLAWRWSENDILVHSLPLFHQHGLSGIHASLVAGSRIVVHSRLDPDRLCATIAEEGATVLFSVPAVYQRLIGCPSFEHERFTTLRLATSGSAPLSPALAERVAEGLGCLPVERYGSTEAGLNLSNPYAGPRRPGTVGLALPGVEVSLIDEKGTSLGPGGHGEIMVRGPQVFQGYENVAKGSAGLEPDGWFRTGDLGRFGPSDGYLSITGRLKELVITGGMNVSPREVELVLETLEGISRAAVVGVPSEQWGEEVVGFVVARDGAHADPSRLLAAARDRLAAYKCPKRLIFCKSLPVNALGKVRRDELVRWAQAEQRGH